MKVEVEDAAIHNVVLDNVLEIDPERLHLLQKWFRDCRNASNVRVVYLC